MKQYFRITKKVKMRSFHLESLPLRAYLSPSVMNSVDSVNIVKSVNSVKCSVKSFSDMVSENLLPSPSPKMSVKGLSECLEEASFLSVQNFPPLKFRECPPMKPKIIW